MNQYQIGRRFSSCTININLVRDLFTIPSWRQKSNFFIYLFHKNHIDWSLGPFFFLKETSYFKLDLIHPFNWLYSEVRNFFITLCNNKHICSIANLLQDSEIYEVEVFQYNKNVILRQEILRMKNCLNKWSSAILF